MYNNGLYGLYHNLNCMAMFTVPPHTNYPLCEKIAYVHLPDFRLNNSISFESKGIVSNNFRCSSFKPVKLS